MNEFVDMHVHSKFSIDGMSTMEDYCLIAGKTGTRVICFTEHVDFNSAEKNLSIVNQSNIQSICDLLFGIVDLFSLVLIFLPLYPKPVDGYIYSVNLFEYEDTAVTIRVVYWTVFIALIIAGIVKILFTHFKFIKGQRVVTSFSIGISILAVLFLAMTREAYAITVVFLLLLVKSALLYKQIKVGIR